MKHHIYVYRNTSPIQEDKESIFFFITKIIVQSNNKLKSQQQKAENTSERELTPKIKEINQLSLPDDIDVAITPKPSKVSFKDVRSFTPSGQSMKAKKSTKLMVRSDKSATILVSIVVLFLITHCYRLALKVYEVASPNAQTMETFKMCLALKR